MFIAHCLICGNLLTSYNDSQDNISILQMRKLRPRIVDSFVCVQRHSENKKKNAALKKKDSFKVCILKYCVILS